MSAISLLNEFLANDLPTRKDEHFQNVDFSLLRNKKFNLPTQFESTEIAHIISRNRLQPDNILLVLINGRYDETYSDLTHQPKDTVICHRADAEDNYSHLISEVNIDKRKFPFAEINKNIAQEGLFIYWNSDLAVPVQILLLASDASEFASLTKQVIIVAENKQLKLTEQYISTVSHCYLNNHMMQLQLQHNAKLERVKIQNENLNAIHLAATFINQQKNSFLTSTNISLGSAFARDDVVVHLEEASDCRLFGFNQVKENNQSIDHHIDIEHGKAHSQSQMLYKTIMDKRSKSIFRGKLLVQNEAQKTLAQQSNHHLLLSKEAEAYSQPELEIYADDVKCKHGATCGQLDEQTLFYLQSRGISRDEALTIVLQGFANEILQTISDINTKVHVERLISYVKQN